MAGDEEGATKANGGAKSLSKNQKRRAKKKLKKVEGQKLDTTKAAFLAQTESKAREGHKNDVDYVPEAIPAGELQGMEELQQVLEKVAPVVSEPSSKDTPPQANDETKGNELEEESVAGDLGGNTDEDQSGDEGNAENQKKLGRRKRKRYERFTIAELKHLVNRPDLVEAHDVASPEALLLMHLKTLPNSVPVPRHWANARKFLQSKRGKERVSYKLPEYIGETGISKIRAALAEQEENTRARRKARDRVNPSLGKMDIDYQVLHDAFFKYQVKPPLKKQGDVYFEGAEHDLATSKFKPGKMSKALLEALEMEENMPPPWLQRMQRDGPPPSYPDLKVPGVNAPIPQGASWGFHQGGWGRPPVDQFDRGLFGDVFGVAAANQPEQDAQKETQLWGTMAESESELDSDSDSDTSSDSGSDSDSDSDSNLNSKSGSGGRDSRAESRNPTSEGGGARQIDSNETDQPSPVDSRKSGRWDKPGQKRSREEVSHSKVDADSKGNGEDLREDAKSKPKRAKEEDLEEDFKF